VPNPWDEFSWREQAVLGLVLLGLAAVLWAFALWLLRLTFWP